MLSDARTHDTLFCVLKQSVGVFIGILWGTGVMVLTFLIQVSGESSGFSECNRDVEGHKGS